MNESQKDNFEDVTGLVSWNVEGLVNNNTERDSISSQQKVKVYIIHKNCPVLFLRELCSHFVSNDK